MGRIACTISILALIISLPITGVRPVGADASGEEEFFRRVRRAVTAEEVETLYGLASEEPWSFREVTHQLADLAMRQTGGPGEAQDQDGLTRFVIAGHLASIYMQVTEDASLAERLKRMQSWNPEDIRARVEVDDLMARAASDAPPSPRQLEESIPVCQKLGDLRCVGLLHGALAAMLEDRGHADPAVLHYEKAAAALRAAGELPRLRDALLARGEVLLRRERPLPAAEALGAAAALSGEVGDLEGEIGCLLLLAQAQVAGGQRSRAFDVLSRARNLAFEADLPVLAARVILARTQLRDVDGPRPISAADYEAAARLAEQGQAYVLVAEAYLAAGRIHAAAGDSARAAAVVEKAVAAARLARMTAPLGGMLVFAGELHAEIQDWDRAAARLRDGAAMLSAAGDAAAEARARQQLGSVLLEAGRAQEADAPLQAALALARREGLGEIEGLAEGGLGAVALARGDREAARLHYRRSAELLEAAGDAFQALRMRRLAEDLAPSAGSRP